jgi:hypothetical protein
MGFIYAIETLSYLDPELLCLKVHVFCVFVDSSEGVHSVLTMSVAGGRVHCTVLSSPISLHGSHAKGTESRDKYLARLQ